MTETMTSIDSTRYHVPSSPSSQVDTSAQVSQRESGVDVSVEGVSSQRALQQLDSFAKKEAAQLLGTPNAATSSVGPAGGGAHPSGLSVMGLQMSEAMASRPAFQKRKDAREEGFQKANEALNTERVFDIATDHDEWLAVNRAALKRRGLPVQAEGHHIRVADLSDEHGGMVARSIAGDGGLAQGDNIELVVLGGIEDQGLIDETRQANAGQLGINDTGRAIAKRLIHSIKSAESTVRSFVEDTRMDRQMDHIDKAGDVRFLNMSWGTNPADKIGDVLRTSLKDGSLDTPLAKELAATLTLPDGANRFRTPTTFLALGDAVKEALQDPDLQAELQAAKASFSATLQEAEQENILTFTSSGNGGLYANAFGDDFYGANSINDMPALVVVGASDVGDAFDASDDVEDRTSSPGEDFVMNGVNLPVGPSGTVASGTSFSAPFALSVASLMSTANPSLNATQLRRVLEHPFVLDQVGQGDAQQLDIADAVELARDWAQFGSE
jgi:ribosomal protein S19E (S16A)